MRGHTFSGITEAWVWAWEGPAFAGSHLGLEYPDILRYNPHWEKGMSQDWYMTHQLVMVKYHLGTGDEKNIPAGLQYQ